MRLHYALRSVLFATPAVLIATGAFAQGETCGTAQVITGPGVYQADGPATGGGAVGGCISASANADWYVYTPSFTGIAQITSCHPMNAPFKDTELSVLTGTCGSLTCVGWNDDTPCSGVIFPSFLQFNVVSGESYYIQWDDRWGHASFYWQLTECYGAVEGLTYMDNNSNGVWDSTETVHPTMLQIDPGAMHHYSSGHPYVFCSDSGSYTITVPNPPLYHTAVPASQSYTVNAQGTVVNGMDFAFQPIPGIYDGEVSLWGWNPWIGHDNTYHINYQNLGTETLQSQVVMTVDPLLGFVSSTPAPTSVVGQVVTWDLGTLALDASGGIHVVLHCDSTVAPDTAMVNTVDLLTTQTDIAPLNNHDELLGHASTSWDPNGKDVDRIALTTDQVSNGQSVEYTVHFQNTGTLPAVNVVVKDPFDSDWDLNGFEMIGATHPYQISVDDQMLIISFPGIMLPDSASDPLGSIGGFSYRLKAKTTSIPGTLLLNHADIYFDFNAPVATNTTVTEVNAPESISEQAYANGFSIYPSPTNGSAYLLWHGDDAMNASINIIDATGRIVLNKNVSALHRDRTIDLDFSTLANGSYTLRITTEKQVRIGTVMVQR